MKTNPIIYKKIPCQFAFLITDYPGNFYSDVPKLPKVVVQIQQLTTLPTQKEFKTYNEARKFIRKLKKIL